MTVQPQAPPGLRRLLDAFTYKPGWSFTLIPAELGRDVLGWQLVVNAMVPWPDSGPVGLRPVREAFEVPAQELDEPGWRLWLLGRVGAVEHAVTCAWFRVGDDRPFSPQAAAAFPR